jgi:hypothetical protein
VLNSVELGNFIDSRLTRAAFRLELLDHYDVGSDGDDYRRFLAGETAPTPERKTPWLRRLRQDAARGILNHRVHVLRRPLTNYLRYEAEWGYAYNAAAGEDIGILDTTDQPVPDGLVDHDFWLIDDQHAIRMQYSELGEFIGAEPAPELLDAYRHTRDAATAAAEPFAVWWATHPEQHRGIQAA